MTIALFALSMLFPVCLIIVAGIRLCLR